MRKHPIIQVLLLLLSFSLKSQTYHFAHYGVRDGLAQSNVSGIIQDRSGFYWMATDGGVSRFDGKNFVNYTIEDGLADNNVSAIFQDKDGNIWLGHENGSLSLYDGVHFTEIKSRLLPKGKKIYSFFQDHSGSLWISTQSEGAIKIIDPSRGVKEKLRIKVYSSKDGLSQTVLSTHEDKKGNLWFLTDVGIKILSRQTRNIEFFRPGGMPLGQITCLSQDKDLNFITGTSAGMVSRYDTEKGSFSTLIGPEDILRVSRNTGPLYVFSVHQDRKGNIWATALDHGVFRFNEKTGQKVLFNTGNGLSMNKVKCIAEDAEGNVLLGTLGEGFEVYTDDKFISYSKANGLLNNQVWSICQDQQGRFWFGTSEGVSVLDPAKEGEESFRNYTIENGLTANGVRSLVSDRNGNVWAGTWGGKVVKFDVQQNRFVQVPALNDIVYSLVSTLLIDHNEVLWIGTPEGIVCYNLHSGNIKTIRTIDGLSDNDVSCIFEASNGEIWIGTKQKGITVYNGKIFKRLSREQGLTYNSISCITEDQSRKIWVGTEGGGAFVFNGKSFRNYKIKNGLVSDYITLIKGDEKNQVWLGSNKGISKFNAVKNAFYTYTSGDGFTGVETKLRAVYQDKARNIWFGSVNGVYRYNPSQDVPISIEPICKITGFKVNLNDQTIQDNVNLSYKENSLIFEFIGISLSNPDGVKYKVKLEGFDEDWKTLRKENSEVYSNLPPNNYVFRVMACNSSGLCSANPVSMQITITPPYWKTWWFYLLVFAAIASILFTYIKVRERNLLNEKRVLEEKVNERTAEVVQKNRELDEINKDITASIRYAKRIQDAILPPDEFVRSHLPHTFILFKPKDIVSGDFYFMADKGERVIFAAVDCTGHGVPGAFMSIVGHNLLERIVGEHNITEPAKILDQLNKSISETLRQNELEENTVRDGMDIALCTYNRKTRVLEYAGAFNPLWLIRNQELIEIKADKFPIGNTKQNENAKFKNHEVKLQKGDTLYVFSDGYCDQFGGPGGKKFKASNLRQLLLKSQHLSMDEQFRLLNDTIEAWRGSHEQVDDILVIGTRYTGD
ncbi:MAG TPA: two-component regulator propeller domain-containing protein [Bacteroidia bacterium]|nr:two-component regulator propeller domain-containing protein [Bacteroidia bacterium]